MEITGLIGTAMVRLHVVPEQSLRCAWFWPASTGLIAAMALVQIVSVRQENHTWDEAIEIASGYSFLKTGEFRMQPEHPPLGKILIA